MTEAVDWSVFTWLFEKRRVRETADLANAALDKLDRAVKARWSAEVKAAYKMLAAEKGAGRGRREVVAQAIDPQLRLFVEKVKHADDAAYRARMDAEDTFDEAERNMSTNLAREGCQKAVQSWELHEKAIRKAEAAPDSTGASD